MQTPFEQTGVASSIAAGEDFLEALAAAHPHVTIQRWGPQAGPVKTRLGMFTVTVGTGPVGVGVIGSIHGNEKSGREGCFAFARDLAESTDPALQSYLAEHSWSFLATANPWGVANNLRRNANDIDLNRDYDLLTQMELFAIRKWMDWGVPELVVDIHEMTNFDSTKQTSTGTMDPSTALAPLKPLGVALDAAITAALTGAGNTWEQYPSWATGTLRTDGHQRWKTVAQLIEQNSDLRTMAQRIANIKLILETALAHHRANVDDYEAAHLAAGGTGGGALPAPPYVPPTLSRAIIRDGVPTQAAVAAIRHGVPVPLT